MLVKMQRPLASNDPDGEKMLVYNRRRNFEMLVPMTPAYEAMFREHGLEQYLRTKLFAEVTLEGDTFLINAISDGDLGW